MNVALYLCVIFKNMQLLWEKFIIRHISKDIIISN